MTPRLQTARAEVARLIARYVPSHMHPTGNEALTKAAAELEEAARVEDDKLTDPPLTFVDPNATPVVPPADAAASTADVNEQVHTIPPEPTEREAVADAMAPYDSSPEPDTSVKPNKRKK